DTDWLRPVMSVPQTSPLPALQRGVFLSRAWELKMTCRPHIISIARIVALGALLTGAQAAIGGEMPKNFAYLRDVDPSIEQDMRYATANNFTGDKVNGYDAPECVLVRQAAEALKAVQADV